MEEGKRLRDLASRCRMVAASTSRKETAETLLEMARQFDESAAAAEHLPLLKAFPTEPTK